MSDSVIKVENVSKAYRLGQIGGGTLREDVSRWMAKLQGKPDPTLKIGEEHHARLMGEQFWALDKVSFEVKAGEVLGIIGRNGAGKSTLLKILSQVTTPTSGEIKIKGRIASLLEVGTGFHPELTGRENVFLNGAILGMTKAEIRKKFDEIVAFSGVEEFIDTPVKRYSSGMYVRLAFAVAAHLEPEILIVDEVLAVGDAEFQKKCLGKMHDVSNNGRTILFVSHNMTAIRQLCNTAVVLQSGKIQFIGKTDSAIQSYSGFVKTASESTFAVKSDKPSITSVKVSSKALAQGNLQIEISFESPFPLNPPVPGFLITSTSGVPVYASNPRFHQKGYEVGSLSCGVVCFSVEKLPICGGCYHLSVWLGDWHTDFDERLDVLAFDFRKGEQPLHRPPSDSIGYLDYDGCWTVKPK
jgi:lipopolysaccharide transport system ATP-binding protein